MIDRNKVRNRSCFPNLPNLDDKKTILCVGCGGVGKTTTTAALGLAAAQKGKHVLCLTIDPAKRLSQSLGLVEMKTESQTIEPSVFEEAGLSVPGSLTVMMLDTKYTFDHLIETIAPNQEKRDRILNNRIYRYISTSLAGTQEYMAMEKLYEVRKNSQYDLILLDTPPTSNALDFLDAPQRLIDAIDSSATRWFIQSFQETGTFSFNLIKKSAATILRGLSKVTGSGFLEEVAEFLVEFNELFGGWKVRAEEVSKGLRGRDVGYVLVTTPDQLAIREVIYFAERLKDQQMICDVFVVNRVHPRYHHSIDAKELFEKIQEYGFEPSIMKKIIQAMEEEDHIGKMDEKNLNFFEKSRRHNMPKSNRVDIPAFPQDVHDLKLLDKVAKKLAEFENGDMILPVVSKQ